MRFGEKEIAKEKFHVAKRPIKICDLNVDNAVISNVVKIKSNYKYLIGYLNKAIRPLILIMPKISGYVKTSKVKEGDKSKRLMSLHVDDEKLLEKCKAIWTKIEDLINIKLKALPVYDAREQIYKSQNKNMSRNILY